MAPEGRRNHNPATGDIGAALALHYRTWPRGLPPHRASGVPRAGHSARRRLELRCVSIAGVPEQPAGPPRRLSGRPRKLPGITTVAPRASPRTPCLSFPTHERPTIPPCQIARDLDPEFLSAGGVGQNATPSWDVLKLSG